jgi:hypothetical protein
MKDTLKSLLGSKKFVFVLGATILVLAASKLGVLTHEEVHHILVVLFPAYVVGQGVADAGHRFGEKRASSASAPAAPVAPAVEPAKEEPAKEEPKEA